MAIEKYLQMKREHTRQKNTLTHPHVTVTITIIRAGLVALKLGQYNGITAHFILNLDVRFIIISCKKTPQKLTI
jgi:hypothetical protein